MISVIIVLLIVLLCFYLGILYTNTRMITLGFAWGLLFLVSLVELVYRYFTLQCKVEVPISMSDQGRPVNVVLKMRNKSPLPAGRVEVQVVHKHAFHTKATKKWVDVHDITSGESKHVQKIVLQGAGRHEVQITKMRIHSLFGLVSMKRKCKDSCSVIIMPEVHAAGVRVSQGIRNFIGEADVYDEFRPGHDSGESFEIREYREKDRLQSIHWKLSAKNDELMVRENSMPKACAVILMLELQDKEPIKGIKGHRNKNWAINADAYFELFASVSFSLMDQKCPHFVAWYSEKEERICRIRVDDEESFYIFLDVYLREASPSQRNVRKEYRDAFRNKWYLQDLTINDKLELYQNGDFLVKLNEKKIKDECEKLELLF